MPYEIGIALLLVHVGFSIHRINDVKLRYPQGHWLWQTIDDLDWEIYIPWWCMVAAFLIIWGLFCHYVGNSSGRVQRSIGLAMGGALFAFIALGHLTVTFYSIAGGIYLFTAWRLLVLVRVYLRKP